MDRRPFFVREPKWQIVFIQLFALALYAVFTERLGGVLPNRFSIGVDFGILMFGLLFWPFFFAQFVLPVRALVERLWAFVNLILYLFGEHGPAQRISEGRIIERSEDRVRRGRGVLLIDPDSAAVLRTEVTFTRAVGPGIHFLNFHPRTQAQEFVAGAVDLRIKSETIGPREREDPFLPRAVNEPDDAYTRRMEARWKTAALTRDGIEIVPNLSVTFRLNAKEGEGRTGYGFNPTSVWRAVTGETVDPNLPSEDARRSILWEKLPTLYAADVWREYVRMFPMSEMFQEAYDGQTGLEIISKMLTLRLTHPRIPELDAFGRLTGRFATSPEYHWLTGRGLKVIATSTFNLRLPPTVEEELIRKWVSTWLTHARKERTQIEAQRSYARESGQRQAWRDFAESSTQFLGELQPADEHKGEVILKHLLEGTLNLTLRDPQLHQRTTIEKSQLVDLLGWSQEKPA